MQVARSSKLKSYSVILVQKSFKQGEKIMGRNFFRKKKPETSSLNPLLLTKTTVQGIINTLDELNREISSAQVSRIRSEMMSLTLALNPMRITPDIVETKKHILNFLLGHENSYPSMDVPPLTLLLLKQELQSKYPELDVNSNITKITTGLENTLSLLKSLYPQSSYASKPS